MQSAQTQMEATLVHVNQDIKEMALPAKVSAFIQWLMDDIAYMKEIGDLYSKTQKSLTHLQILMNVLQEWTNVVSMQSVLTLREVTPANVRLVTVEMDALAEVSYTCGAVVRKTISQTMKRIQLQEIGSYCTVKLFMREIG